MTDPQAPPDRAVDVALAEFNALRAEILAHTASQNTVLGLGFTAIGVLVGLAINNPARSGLLILVPILCSVLIVVHAGLAYRIVVAGNYIRFVLWKFLVNQCPPGRRPPSWEASLAALESRDDHGWRASIVEIALSVLLFLVGLASTIAAVWVLREPRVLGGGLIVTGLLIAAAVVALKLGGRRALDPAVFEPNPE